MSAVLEQLGGWPGGALAVIGLICLSIHRRLPAGLGASLFVGAVSLGAGWWLSRGTTDGLNLYVAGHATAALCAFWSLCGWIAARVDRSAESERRPSAADTFYAWSLVTGIFAVVMVVNTLVGATLSRVLNPGSAFIRMPAGDEYWDILALFAAVLFWFARGPRPVQPTMMLVCFAILAWWTALLVPASWSAEAALRGTWLGGRLPRWWGWEFQLQVGLSLLLVGAAVAQDLRYRTRRKRAWPDELHLLLEPYSRWPWFPQVEAILAGALLILGVHQIVTRETLTWPAALAGCVMAGAAGISCLFMSYRRWSGNTASLGIALLTLSAALFGCFAALLIGVVPADASYADRIPVLYNAILFALAIAAVWWRWLAGVWDQQLHDGEPWTTTGRMIPLAKRGAFIIGCLAMLIAFQMALWPRLAPACRGDGGWGRIIAGSLAMILPAMGNARLTVKQDRKSAAMLSLSFVLALVIFIFLRMPPSPMRGWLIQHGAVALAFVALPVLAVAEALPRSRWRNFAPPLWALALMLIPAAAMAKLLSPEAQPAEWVRPMTLAILGALYSFAGSRERRRALLVLGVVLLFAALTDLNHAYGMSILAVRVH